MQQVVVRMKRRGDPTLERDDKTLYPIVTRIRTCQVGEKLTEFAEIGPHLIAQGRLHRWLTTVDQAELHEIKHLAGDPPIVGDPSDRCETHASRPADHFEDRRDDRNPADSRNVVFKVRGRGKIVGDSCVGSDGSGGAVIHRVCERISAGRKWAARTSLTDFLGDSQPDAKPSTGGNGIAGASASVH